MLNIKAKQLTDDEIPGALNEIRECVENLRKNCLRIAALLGRMSVPQINRAKEELKGILTADNIERLALCGRGKIAPHLALPDAPFSASMLRRLRGSILRQINDPKCLVKIYSPAPKGVVSKPVLKLSRAEVCQCFDPETGFIEPHIQARRFTDSEGQPPAGLGLRRSLGSNETKKEYERFLKLRQDGAFLLIFGEEGSCIRVPIKTLKAMIK